MSSVEMRLIIVITWVLPTGSGTVVIKRASHERCGRGLCVCAGLLERCASMRSEAPPRAPPRPTQEAITDNHRAVLLTLTFINEHGRTIKAIEHPATTS